MNQVEDSVAPVDRFEPAAQDQTGFARLWLRGHERPFLIGQGELLFAVWAELLGGLAGTERVVYVEAERGTRQIARILLPRVEKVVSVAQAEAGRLTVRTLTSPRDFWVRSDKEDLKHILQWATDAPGRELLLTIDPDTEEVLSAIPFEVPDFGAPAPPAGPPPPPPQRAVLSELELDIAFVSLLRCRIPFDYLRDGCATRAHEMFRLLRLQGIQCDKVWLYAPFAKKLMLKAPAADVQWNFHVAPRVQVQLAAGQAERVLDPSTFLRPVSESRWVELLTGHLTSKPSPQHSPPEVYGRLPGGLGTLEYDPTFRKTAADLQVYRYERARLLAPRFIPWG